MTEASDQEAAAALEQERKRVKSLSHAQFRAAVAEIDGRHRRALEQRVDWKAIDAIRQGRQATELSSDEWQKVKKLLKSSDTL